MSNNPPYSIFELWIWADFLPHSLNGKPLGFATLNEILKAGESEPLLLEAAAACLQKKRIGTSAEEVAFYSLKSSYGLIGAPNPPNWLSEAVRKELEKLDQQDRNQVVQQVERVLMEFGEEPK